MDFSLKELNELIYAVGTASRYGNLVDKKVANRLWARLSDELDRRMKLYDLAENGPEVERPESMFDDIWPDNEPEYDSAGFTEDDRIVDGQYNVIKDPIGGGE
jgi:hypothetical protein